MELIAVLEKAQQMPMPESQKFGILRTIMAHEERPHVRAVYGMASYNKESFNATIKKIREEWDTISLEKVEVRMAASVAPPSSDRICLKFQTGECSRPICPFIHKLMSATERKEQNYIAKPPGKREILRAGIRKAILVTRNLRVKLIRETITRRAPMGCIIICH